MSLPKVEIHRILCATDLSENSRCAFAYAVSLANLYEAKLIILHVLADDEDVEEKLMDYVAKTQWEDLKRQKAEEARDILIGKKKQSETIRRVLQHFCDAGTDGLNAACTIKDEIIVDRGDPVDRIIVQAEGHDCDLIILGSHGQTTLAEKRIGSTAENVMRQANQPVLIVRRPHCDAVTP